MHLASIAQNAIRRISIAVTTFALVAASGLAAAGNGAPSVVPVELVFANGFQNPDTSFCSSLALSSPNAAPASQVKILNIPTELRLPEVQASRAGELLGRLAIQRLDTGEVAVIAPLLESAQSSYVLDLTLTGILDGEFVLCDGLSLTVDPLPAVEGDPITDTLQSFDTSITELKRLLGAADVDLTQNPAGLPEALRLLAYLDYLIQGDNNENSLTNIMNGTAPAVTQRGGSFDPTLLQQLLISSGTRDALEDLAAALQAESMNGSRGVLSYFCPEDMSDPDELVECMNAQGRLAFVVGERAKLATLAVTSLLGAFAILVPPASVSVTVAGFIIFAVQTASEVVSEALPNKVGPLEFTITKNEFFEDEQGTSGSWNDITVTASGDDVTLSWFTFVEAGLQVIGPFAETLSESAQTFLPALEEAMLEVYLLIASAINEVLDLSVPAEASAAVTWPSIDYGPVNMTGPQFHNVVINDLQVSFDVNDEQRTYTKSNTLPRGETSWQLALESDIFAGYFPNGNKAEGSQTISLPQIEVDLVAPATASPGETIEVFATVDKAIERTLNFEVTPNRGTLDMGDASDGTYNGTYTAPSDGTLPVIITITATHPTITERTESVQIRVGPEIEITPVSACVAPGETQQFMSNVTGLADTSVTWTASVGSITSGGLFIAPESIINQDVVITATSIPDPLTTDSVTVRTGPECVCYFNAFVSGDTSAFFNGPAQVQMGSDGALNFTFRSRGWINGDLPNAVQSVVNTVPSVPAEPGTYTVGNAGVNFVDPPYSANYIPGVEGADCPSCGGSLTIGNVVADQTVEGITEVVLFRRDRDNPEGPGFTALLQVEFRAAFGSQFDGGSLYVQCSTEYGD